MRSYPESQRLLNFVGKQESKGKETIVAFRKRLAQDVVNHVHAEQSKTAEMAEKELMRLLKLFKL